MRLNQSDFFILHESIIVSLTQMDHKPLSFYRPPPPPLYLPVDAGLRLTPFPPLLPFTLVVRETRIISGDFSAIKTI